MDMYSQDIEIAKRRLERGKLSMSIVKHWRIIFETKSHGVAGFVEAIERVKSRLRDASVADRVLGRAIALLCVYAKVKSVYAETVSMTAKAILESNTICLEHRMLVDRILSADRTKTCPFEQLIGESTNPSEAYFKFKAACRPASRSNAVGMTTYE
jgi:hypothetical protein